MLQVFVGRKWPCDRWISRSHAGDPSVPCEAPWGTTGGGGADGAKRRQVRGVTAGGAHSLFRDLEVISRTWVLLWLKRGAGVTALS